MLGAFLPCRGRPPGSQFFAQESRFHVRPRTITREPSQGNKRFVLIFSDDSAQRLSYQTLRQIIETFSECFLRYGYEGKYKAIQL